MPQRVDEDPGKVARWRSAVSYALRELDQGHLPGQMLIRERKGCPLSASSGAGAHTGNALNP